MKHLLTLIFLLLLYVPGWGHGGEEHADIREEAAHAGATPTAPAGPPHVSVKEFGSADNRYVVTFRRVPAEPQLGQETQIEASIKKRLDPPDPLLGAEMTVEGATIKVTQERPSSKDLGEAHAEAEPGSYGTHINIDEPGETRLIWVVQQEGEPEFFFDYSFTVRRPLKQTVALAITAIALGGMLLYSLLRRRMSWGGWVAAVFLSAAALAYAFLYTPEPAAPKSTPVTAVAAEPGLQIPVDLQRDLEMSVEAVTLKPLPQTIRAPGAVVIPAGSTHELSARFSSQLLTDPPRVGQYYERGEQIALLEEVLTTSDRASLRGQTIDLKTAQLDFATRQLELKRQLAELESQRRVAAMEVTQRQLDLSRSEQLYAIQAIPKKELQAARTAHQQAVAQLEGLKRQQAVVGNSPPMPDLPPATGLQQYSLVAPISGVISQVDAARGEVVDPSKVLFTIVDLSTVWVQARISEKDLAAARGSQSAQISTVAYPGPFYGRFVSVAPGLDPETRTALVNFAVNNGESRLLEGMSAEVELGGIPLLALTVPNDALQTFENESRVFVQLAPDRFEARTVKVERTVGDFSVITGDVKEGTKVVVRGAGALASEMARRAATSTGPSGSPTPDTTGTPHLDDGHAHPEATMTASPRSAPTVSPASATPHPNDGHTH